MQQNLQATDGDGLTATNQDMTRAQVTSHPLTRTQFVWGTFASAMTLMCGLLLLVSGGWSHTLTTGPMLGPEAIVRADPGRGILATTSPIDPDRWDGIVIHHSASPAGDATRLAEMDRRLGLDGLRYHFVIGNGNGLGDGDVHVGYRWSQQLNGAHVAGAAGPWHNAHSVAICLIGNGESREFTSSQIETLISLITTLQEQLGVSRAGVKLHRDIAQVTSPGRFFPEARLLGRLVTGSN